MRYLLPPCTALAVLLNISPALAGVNSLELTVSTTITPLNLPGHPARRKRHGKCGCGYG
jgi:hypothetical protein